MIATTWLAHDGHAHMASQAQIDAFIYWLGTFHPMFLSFPIALITMTVIAELIYSWHGHILFEHAARFMLLAAAILVIPTVIFGLALGYNAAYPDPQADFFWWHRALGLLTMGLVIIAAYLREYHGRTTPYLCFLGAAFVSVFLTGFFGGNLTFDFVEASSLLFKSI